MRNLIIGVLILAALGYFGTKWKLHQDVESGVDMAVMMMSPFAVVQYDGVSSTMTGELTIDGIRGRVKGFNDEFFIARLGIDTPSFLSLMKFGDMQSLVTSGDDMLPKYFGLIVEGLRMPSNADYGYKLHEEQIKQLGVNDADEPANECTGKYGLSPDALLAMGYTEYDLSLSARFRQLGDRYAVEIQTSSKDMWEVDAELILVGNMATELAKGPRYRPKMGEMRVEYVDRSLKERIAGYCRTQGLTDDEILEAQLDAFRHFGSESGIEFDEYVMEPYKEFLEGKSTLVVTAKPNEPVTLSQITLYKPSDVPALLQLSAEAH
ncbi:MAG: hypothetical protein OER97_08655 [Gammaproteobacteria bacterium]|nr:hypothetical protein [Gammaproteobacteria bacterium]